MRDDDRDEPFDDFFSELERMMNDMIGGNFDMDVQMEGVTPATPSETHVDVYETDGEVRVVADLPGAEKDDIDLACDGRVLTIEATGDRRDYDERVRLPTPVDEQSASASYNNGVLEVVFTAADESTGIDVS